MCVYHSATRIDTLLSHVFTCCTADVLLRYLQFKGHPVTLDLVLNNNGTIPAALFTNLQTLNVLPPDHIYSVENGQGPGKAADILIFDGPKHGDVPPAPLCLETAVPQTQQTTLTKLEQTYSADVLRAYLAQHHYRHSWVFDEVLLQKAALFVEKLKAAMSARSTGPQPININPVQKRFTAVMDNDLDTGKGLATLLNLADEILFRASNGYQIEDAQTALQQMTAVFGLRLTDEAAAQNDEDNGWHTLRQRLGENQA